MVARHGTAEKLLSFCLVIKERSAATIKRSDRGDAGHRAANDVAKVCQERWWNEVHGVERPPGHFQVAELQGESDPIGLRPALNDNGQFFCGRCEEALELERRQRLRETRATPIPLLPATHMSIALRRLASQRPVEGGLADLNPAGGFAHIESFGDENLGPR